jgi:nicotinamidase-related amidase
VLPYLVFKSSWLTCAREGIRSFIHANVRIHETIHCLPFLAHFPNPSRSHNTGHRPDLSTLSSRELFRSRLATGRGIGDEGPLGRFLTQGSPGIEIVSEIFPHKNDIVIDKPGRSAFAHTDFEHILRLRGIRNLVFCGVTTDVCVHTSMREANDRGFDCCLVSDASAAGTEDLHKWAIESVKGEGGIFGCVSTVEEVVAGVSWQAEGVEK